MRAERDSILGYSGQADWKGRDGRKGATGNIAAGALIAADAVFRNAAREGIAMKVAWGGGSNRHSSSRIPGLGSYNHGSARSGIGESIDVKPINGWKNTAQRERYGRVAAGAGANRVGVSYNGIGLHVQVSKGKGLTGQESTAWIYKDKGQRLPKDNSFKSIKAGLKSGTLNEENRRRTYDLFGKPEYDPLKSIGRRQTPTSTNAPIGKVESRDLTVPPAKLDPGYGPTKQIEQRVVSDLMRDYSLTRHQAAGIVGNLSHESAGFKAIQEMGQGKGKGGLGWAQYTGSRRDAFEK
ncbi:MAG: hypothetical protein H0W99_16265, partial [Acidobacteria bacterium]|nr:hypothetical protein [Acidobacteriota bacterium]